MTELNELKCTKCGQPLRQDSLVCMHCGRAVRTLPVALNSTEMEKADKKSTIAIARFISIGVLVMNIITILLCKDKEYTHMAYMWPAICCAVVSLFLVLISLAMGKGESNDDLNAKADMVFKGAVGVLIFSGIEFFLAIGETLFPML